MADEPNEEEHFSYPEGPEKTEEAPASEFRNRIGLLPEEEQDLTDAFKSRIGLSRMDGEAACDIGELELAFDTESEVTLSRFQFSKFAKNYFQEGSINEFSAEPLTIPLLAKKSEIDHMASLATWLAIKRFCSDIATPVELQGTKDPTPVIMQVFYALEQLFRKQNPAPENKKGLNFKLLPKTSSIKKLFGSKKESSGHSSSGGLFGLINNKSSSKKITDLADIIPADELDIAQFIVSLGILRKELRDEIYAQLCCQVTNNPSTHSLGRGWLLHSLCAGCFMPSQLFLNHYFGFLHNAPTEFRDYGFYIQKTLRRTNTYGTRYHPTNWIEFQSASARKYAMVPVTLPSNVTERIECDSAMTASEMCDRIATKIGLRDNFGYAIFVSTMGKVSSLGNGMDHIMDALSECEQMMRVTGGNEKDTPWYMYFKKEVFSPWHDVALDNVSTELIYSQIVQSIQTEELRMRYEEEVARYAARRWYIDFNKELIPGQIHSRMHDILPPSLLSASNSRDNWVPAIKHAYDKLGLADGKISTLELKRYIVDSSRLKWPICFSAMFEAFQVGGPPLLRSDIILAVNGRGLFFIEEPCRILVAEHYYELLEVEFSKDQQRGPCFTVVTIKGNKLKFMSANAETVSKLVTTFLDGLRRRSKWAIAVQEFVLQDHTQDEEDLFQFQVGDLIELLDESSQTGLKEDWMYGRSAKTGKNGSFPFESVYVLPTSERPPDEFLALFQRVGTIDMATLPKKRGTIVLSRDTRGDTAI